VLTSEDFTSNISCDIVEDLENSIGGLFLGKYRKKCDIIFSIEVIREINISTEQCIMKWKILIRADLVGSVYHWLSYIPDPFVDPDPLTLNEKSCIFF